jgi:isopentenyl diphosphate isomerase/L-lactate dehydrogenase-like FMN-dependent dehydrogenase
MNNHERAAQLMEKAERLGCETPTESMIAEAIHNAEEDAHTDIEVALRQIGMKDAAAAVGRWRERRYADSENAEGDARRKDASNSDGE